MAAPASAPFRSAFESSPANIGHTLQDVIASLARAADQGQDALFSEARILFRTALGAADTRILTRSAGMWREWNRIEAEDGLDENVAVLVDRLQPRDAPVRSGRFLVAPVRGSSVAVVIEIGEAAEAPASDLQCLCHVLYLALGSCESGQGNPDKLEAIRVFQRVANQILKSGDLNDVFTQITHEAKVRLSADICGVMLKEDDWLVMQRCVGNLASATASLRMRSGQGVAGRVLETGKPCAIEDYIHSEIISRDFFSLARAERVKSALAVPLLSQNEVIGALEVWRRRPSRFTPQHTAELATLANLASLAIENVRLAQARESAARRLELAHKELQARYDVIRMSADLQEGLTSLLLAGASAPEIAERASLHLSRPVLLLDRRLDVEACGPRDFEFEPLLRDTRTEISKAGAEARAILCGAAALRFYCQRIVAGAEFLGWAVVFGGEDPGGSVQLALGEICVTVALHRMKERAAARALSDRLSSLLWDMVEAPEDLRRAALQRARDCGVDLSGDICVMVCSFQESPRRNGARPPDRGVPASWRQMVGEFAMRLPSSNRDVKLSTLRGDELILVAAMRGGAQPRELAEAICKDLDRAMPGVITCVGVSRSLKSPDLIPSACKDAQAALTVTRQANQNRVLAIEDIGVAGLLLSMRDGADLRQFAIEKMRGLFNESARQREALLDTLRIYFASNCSQSATAKRLRLHQKTIAYRLEKIEKITGLDLNLHESRMLLDLAVRMNDLLA
ncbi:GAF domain-containing protein [Roseiarcus fermentans]|uniref:GAF domain-containing protein n=2 Tax=Roseiarcus fermentans TaxID=1473586 RepID=A0A366FN59_9HYPH|nr:GAF domain-containing protein [Roseiarcus fermentans]